MTGRTLSPREARLVALLILVAVIGALWLLVAAPFVRGFAERSAQRADLAARVAANDRLIAAVPRLRTAAEARGRALGAVIQIAPDTATAAAILRDRLQAALVQTGGSFRGAEDLPGTRARVACRLRARLSPDQLNRFLVLVQNARPAVVITSLVVSGEESLVTGRASALDVQLEASLPVRLAASR
ncbi:type II secretion system protein GspM [Novosphingobium sp.]|uniref:type II secretion system protein GspM n=1 Tax=Novosphingobium sp. TaxID=1874826 RepID=UPI003BA89E13